MSLLVQAVGNAVQVGVEPVQVDSLGGTHRGVAERQAKITAGPDKVWFKVEATGNDYAQACRMCYNEADDLTTRYVDMLTLNAFTRARYIDCMESFGYRLVRKNVAAKGGTR